MATAVASTRSADGLAASSRIPFGIIVEVRILGFVLLGYALFDRAFAWLHVPGTPLFIGEVALVVLLLFGIRTGHRYAPLLHRNPPFFFLVCFMALGLVRTVPFVMEFGVDAIRDSALWYYGLFAFAAAAIVRIWPSGAGALLHGYRKSLPWIALWGPIAVVLGSTVVSIMVPDSPIDIFSHKQGNVAVHSAMGIAFLWLLPVAGSLPARRMRLLLTAVLGVTILLAGAHNRGGFLAALVGLGLVVVFARGNRLRIVSAVGVVVTVILVVAISMDLRVSLLPSREISAQQLLTNITSIVNPSGGDAQLQSTTQWRTRLWGTVIDDVSQNSPLMGRGFGLNLGTFYGVQDEDPPLRSTHNSHIHVLARMGWIGIAIWLVMWFAWYARVYRAGQNAKRHGDLFVLGMSRFLLVSATAILLNAVFDPTLEGAQVAAWLWTLFGIGAILPNLRSVERAGAPDNEQLRPPQRASLSLAGAWRDISR